MPKPEFELPGLNAPGSTFPRFDFDVISQPAMPPPPVRPDPDLGKTANPRHNAVQGEQR